MADLRVLSKLLKQQACFSFFLPNSRINGRLVSSRCKSASQARRSGLSASLTSGHLPAAADISQRNCTLPGMSTHSDSNVSTDCSEDFEDILIRELDSDLVCSLALTIRCRAPVVPNSPDFTCSIPSSPKRGSYNVVYEVEFSDGISWAVRTPCLPWNVKRERTMQHDMVGLQYVSDHTTLPVPRIHAYDCTTNNAIGHPYMVADYVHGTRLVDVWSKPSWWSGERSKQRLLTAIAGYMVELSKHEFDQIGCLERIQP
ncbi:hypothetical protein OH76DRAFT_1470902 [Lentinus brumalis]|uniref:Aminoglycoside phosphotransferase domain-containing protein n=1 Tax=Lentinus brumalis TaxID=2498619 RepID=A0A371DG26_9APHY|nr:hypothetical protein OH76DRAFT_1470902 [Polyporus brumalis]